jgi:3,4-dihydroxy 2-butanone 4-phosphate synthase/GTP cyclohydrolase II
MRTERMVKRLDEGVVDVPGLGAWRMRLYEGVGAGGLHVAMSFGDLGARPTLVRVQAAPPSWALLGSGVSALASDARAAMEEIAKAGHGALVFMHATPRDGMVQHQFASDFGSTSGAPTPKAADMLRDLGMGCQILVDLGLKDLQILTRSSRPIAGIDAYGLRVVERITNFGVGAA